MSAFVSLGREQLDELDRLALADELHQLVHALVDALAPVRDLVREQRLPALQQLLERADEVEETRLQHLLAARRRTAAPTSPAASRWRRGSRASGAGRRPPPCSAGTRAGAASSSSRGSSTSSSPCDSVGSTGTSSFDLMWMSVAAITMNSPATSRFSSCIRSRYSMYWRVMGAIGEVVDVDLVPADQVQQQVERPVEHRERGCAGRPTAATTRRPRARVARPVFAGRPRRLGRGCVSASARSLSRRRTSSPCRRSRDRIAQLHRRPHLLHGGVGHLARRGGCPRAGRPRPCRAARRTRAGAAWMPAMRSST